MDKYKLCKSSFNNFFKRILKEYFIDDKTFKDLHFLIDKYFYSEKFVVMLEYPKSHVRGRKFCLNIIRLH